MELQEQRRLGAHRGGRADGRRVPGRVRLLHQGLPEDGRRLRGDVPRRQARLPRHQQADRQGPAGRGVRQAAPAPVLTAHARCLWNYAQRTKRRSQSLHTLAEQDLCPVTRTSHDISYHYSLCLLHVTVMHRANRVISVLE